MRGDVVRLSRSYASTVPKKPYPEAIKRLLRRDAHSKSLLMSTVKIDGRLSIQLQSSNDDGLLNWAMAECDQNGIMGTSPAGKRITMSKSLLGKT